MVGLESRYDFNRDMRVDLVDVGLARSNQSGFSSLRLIDLSGSGFSGFTSGKSGDSSGKSGDSSLGDSSLRSSSGNLLSNLSPPSSGETWPIGNFLASPTHGHSLGSNFGIQTQRRRRYQWSLAMSQSGIEGSKFVGYPSTEPVSQETWLPLSEVRHTVNSTHRVSQTPDWVANPTRD